MHQNRGAPASAAVGRAARKYIIPIMICRRELAACHGGGGWCSEEREQTKPASFPKTLCHYDKDYIIISCRVKTKPTFAEQE